MKSIVLCLLTFIAASAVRGAELPELNVLFGEARAYTADNSLVVTTGVATREWLLTKCGLATGRIVNEKTGQVWSAGRPTEADSDWLAPGVIGDSPVEVESVTASRSTDHGFTSPHLRVLVTLKYPATDCSIQLEIWAYPGSRGMRTQLWVAGKPQGVNSVQSSQTFQLLKGKFTPAAKQSLPKADAVALVASQSELKLKLLGLNRDKLELLKLTWAAEKSASTSAGNQRVTLSSVDGESKVQLPAKRIRQDAEGRRVALIEISPDLKLDGTVTVSIKAAKGGGATTLSAAHLYRHPGEAQNFDQLQIAVEDPYANENLSGMQLVASLRRPDNPRRKAQKSALRLDRVPSQGDILAVGYYNDTQHRHQASDHLYREQAYSADEVQEKTKIIDWANLLFIESEQGGLALIKESHKCANQHGVDTGAFKVLSNRVEVTGWGLPTAALVADKLQWCWATWMVVYDEATAATRELSIKQFDRRRYPLDMERDAYVKANTWGSGNNGQQSQRRAYQHEVVAELKSVADLGITSLQIDDGWQTGRMGRKQPKEKEWLPRPDIYPNGWNHVVRVAKKEGIRLGIWLAARAPLEALKWNYDQGGFRTWKLDFAALNHYKNVANYLQKGREFIAYTGHKIRINWDVTENAPRFGYFWARECGPIWLANRKINSPSNVVPHPWLMLRETWELSKYLNSNRFELPIQNFALVNQKISDAHLYSDAYSVALGLSGTPVFFQTTRLLKPEQREVIRTWLDAYKQHQPDLFERYVVPIGDEPNNASWAGFQWVSPADPVGYLLVFRERLNKNSMKRIPLRHISPESSLLVTNLLTQATTLQTLDENSEISLGIPAAGDVLFLRTQLQPNE